MSEAAAGICRLKCFCLCFCWTFRAKPEPRIPWEGTQTGAHSHSGSHMTGLALQVTGAVEMGGHRVAGSGRPGLPSTAGPTDEAAPLASLLGRKGIPRRRTTAAPRLVNGMERTSSAGRELPIHRGDQVIHIHIHNSALQPCDTYIWTTHMHTHMTHTHTANM